MERLVLYCKTYARDLPLFSGLLESVRQFNRESIPCYVSVPRADAVLFRDRCGSDICLLDDEAIWDIAPGFENGWINQQIVKSCFFRLGLCKNYVCLDADGLFLREFSHRDFLVDGVTPYTVCHELKDLFAWSAGQAGRIGCDPQAEFEVVSDSIRDFFGNPQSVHYDFGPSPVVFNCELWRSFHDRCLTPYNVSLEDLFYHAPSEFSWYGQWLVKTRAIPLFPREPYFKVFHYRAQYDDFLAQGGAWEHLGRVYLGIVRNSNWFLAQGLPAVETHSVT